MHERSKKSIRKRAIIGFDHGPPCRVKKHGPRVSVTTKTSAFGLGFCLLSPSGHVFHTSLETMIKSYIIKWLRGLLARNCSGCLWRRDVWSYNSRCQAVACVTMESACQPPSWCQCRYGSLWLCLNLRLIHPKNTLICLWWLMIPHKLFW